MQYAEVRLKLRSENVIKVMQVSTDSNIGGAGIWLLTFLKFYDREKIDVVVVIPEDSALKSRIEELGVRYIEAEGIRDVSFSKEAIGNLREIIRREKPDVIHTHASLSARIAAKLENVPAANTRHCLEAPKKGIKRLIYRTLNNYLSDAVVAVSKAVYNNLSEDGIPDNKLRLIYNGVQPLEILSLEKIQEIKSGLGLENSFTVGIFARLESVKNHMLFLRAAAAMYQVNDAFRFIIVGGGSMEEELKKEVKRLGIEKAVIFTGYVKDVTGYMNAVDVNVLTSDFEALSISLIEGMTVGKPCVTTDAGGTREVVENGVSGFVVPVNDAVNLSACIMKLASDPALCRCMGEAGRKMALEKFSPVEMCDKLYTMYEELADI